MGVGASRFPGTVLKANVPRNMAAMSIGGSKSFVAPGMLNLSLGSKSSFLCGTSLAMRLATPAPNVPKLT